MSGAPSGSTAASGAGSGLLSVQRRSSASKAELASSLRPRSALDLAVGGAAQWGLAKSASAVGAASTSGVRSVSPGVGPAVLRNSLATKLAVPLSSAQRRSSASEMSRPRSTGNLSSTDLEQQLFMGVPMVQSPADVMINSIDMSTAAAPDPERQEQIEHVQRELRGLLFM